MDLTFSEQQQAISDLAGRILAETCTPDALRALERAGEGASKVAWDALGRADLLGLALPERDGGSGLGLVEAGLVAEQVGRHVAPVPYWPTTAAALTVAERGSDALRARALAGVADGSAPVTAALWEPGSAGMVALPSTRARRDDAGWSLTGVKGPVPAAAAAGTVLVPARLDDEGVAVFAVDPSLPGVSTVEEQAMSHEPLHTLHLDAVAVPDDARLADGTGPPGPEDDDSLHHLVRRATVLACATALGVAEGALALTARHVTEREQFGSPIGTFQAVAHRCADAYIDTEAIRLTTWQAAWRIDAGLDAGDAVATAAFWAAGGGHRVVHAAQHLHGGIGVDIDYPVHRYFRWAKVLEAFLGGTSAPLARLGASLAGAEPGGSRPSSIPRGEPS